MTTTGRDLQALRQTIRDARHNMQVIYHLGAHCTDNDHIVKCLAHNAQALERDGIIVPEPTRYRTLIAETMLKLRHQDVSGEIQNTMMDQVLGEQHAKRLILSHDGFLGVPGQALGNGVFYPMLGDKIERLAKLFGGHDVEFCIALSNPAVFIPDVFSMAQEADLKAYLNGSDPMQMRWSELIVRLKNAVPSARVTVWANEDTPLIWPEVLQAVSGHSDQVQLTGLEEFYASLMSPGGVKRMTGYLETHPPKDAAHLQRIVGAFLDKFGLEDVLETEVDMPGWSETYVASLSELYDQDVAVIASMSEIEFLDP